MEEYDRTARVRLLLLSSSSGERKRPALNSPRTAVNATSRATLGLEALYARVAVRAGLKRARPWANASSIDGSSDPAITPIPARSPSTFMVENSASSSSSQALVPLMGHRYRCVSTIGEGTFAHVIRAEDTFRPGKSVAIKVMDLSYGAIGRREVRCMRFLNSVPHAEFSPVVKLLDAFTYRGHYCLVMEMLDGSLLPHTLRAMQESQEQVGQTAVHNWRLDNLAGSRLWDRGRGEGLRLAEQSEGAAILATAKRSLEESSGWAGSVGLSRTPRCAHVEDAGRTEGARTAIPGVPTHVIRHIALQMVSALLLMHSNGMVHADIKPENVLLGVDNEQENSTFEQPCTRPFSLEDLMRGRAPGGGGVPYGQCSAARLVVKLCDFGNTIHTSEAGLYYDDFEIQTLAYRAPEVLMGCPFGPAIDTWSVGLVLLELVLGRPLFHTAGSRAALLRQTVCAFGPLPLRRFGEGRFFSEYYDGDSSLKSDVFSPQADNRSFGCCSCCWMGDRFVEGAGVRAQRRVRSCAGSCALRCHHPSLRKGFARPPQAAGQQRVRAVSREGFSVPATATASNQAPANTGTHSWRIAYAHLCRLISAAETTYAQRSGYAKGGSENANSFSIARRNPRLLSLLAGLLCLNPDERLTPLQALAHPFFGAMIPFAIPLGSVVGLQRTEASPSAPGTLPRRTAARRAWAGAAVPIPRGLPNPPTRNEGPGPGPQYPAGAVILSTQTAATNGIVNSSMSTGAENQGNMAIRASAAACATASHTACRSPAHSPPAPSSNAFHVGAVPSSGTLLASVSFSTSTSRMQLPEMSQLQGGAGTIDETGGRDGSGSNGGTDVNVAPTRPNRFLSAATLAVLKSGLVASQYRPTHPSPRGVPSTATMTNPAREHRVDLQLETMTEPAIEAVHEPPKDQITRTQMPLPPVASLLSGEGKPPHKHKHNRFLTPAAFTKPNSAPTGRNAQAAAKQVASDKGPVSEATTRRERETTATRTRAKRSLVATRANDYLLPPKMEGSETQMENRIQRQPPKSTGGRREQRRKRSCIGQPTYSDAEVVKGNCGTVVDTRRGKSTPRRSQQEQGGSDRRRKSDDQTFSDFELAEEDHRTVSVVGRAKTPRRAAIVAGAAVRRLLDEDAETADDSM